MKRYRVINIRAARNMEACDTFTEAMDIQGFKLVMIKSHGRFYFEYDPTFKDHKYYSFTNINGLVGANQLVEVNSELKRIFNAVEIIRKGTPLTIYRLSENTIKDKYYLKNLAKARCMEEFDYDTYLNVLRTERDIILKRNKTVLTIILALVTIAFLAGGIFVGAWVFILMGVSLFFTLIQLYERIMLSL